MRATLSRTLQKYAIIAAVVGALAVVGFGAYYLVFVSTQKPGVGTPFALYENGAYRFYALVGRHVYPLPQKAPDADDAPVPVFWGPALYSGVRPAIMSASGGLPTIVGAVRPDGSVVPLIENGTFKSALTANARGAVVFSEMRADPASGTHYRESGKWRLVASSLSDSTPLTIREIGAGFSAAFTDSGMLVALTGEGAVAIHTDAALSESVIERSDLEPWGAAVSLDGEYVALYNPVTDAFDFFTILNGGFGGYVDSVQLPSDVRLREIAFLSSRTGIIRVSPDTFALFEIKNGGVLETGTALLAEQAP